MRIRIQINADPDPGEKQMQIHVRPKKIQKPFLKAVNHVYFTIMVDFHVPRSGSAFPIWIRIQHRQINAEQDPQNCIIV
jgi:hypothetical protein